MTRVFITGPTGAIGMALIRLCIKQNIECYAMVRPNSNRKWYIPIDENVHVVECELKNLSALTLRSDTAGDNSLALNIHNCDVFFHLGWEGTTGKDREDESLQEKNVQYTLEAVRLAYRLGCHHFVGTGSQAEYGRVSGKLKSDTPTAPETMYGKAKLKAGDVSRELCREYGINHVWSRILSVYGPYDTPNSLISSTISKLINGEALGFTPGEQDWDFIYADDAARALLLLGDKGVDGNIYPIGFGSTKKIAEYLTILAEEYARILECKNKDSFAMKKVIDALGKVDYSPKQVMYLCADISELTSDTGFLPEISFREGIRNTILFIFNQNMI